MMSRAYRIRVAESLTHVLRASDHVCTQLQLLEILPRDDMAQLLEEELARRGFRKCAEVLVRREGEVTVTVDPAAATVTVQAENTRKTTIEAEKEGRFAIDSRAEEQQAEERLRESLRQELQKKTAARAAAHQAEVTGRLEAHLADLRQELNQAINRVTAEALKRKAAQMGQIKEISEDGQSGSLTIVLEV